MNFWNTFLMKFFAIAFEYHPGQTLLPHRGPPLHEDLDPFKIKDLARYK